MEVDSFMVSVPGPGRYGAIVPGGGSRGKALGSEASIAGGERALGGANGAAGFDPAYRRSTVFSYRSPRTPLGSYRRFKSRYAPRSYIVQNSSDLKYESE